MNHRTKFFNIIFFMDSITKDCVIILFHLDTWNLHIRCRHEYIDFGILVKTQTEMCDFDEERNII